jgi:hypothetical protein
MKTPKPPSDPRELDPYGGPKNFDEVLRYLGINKDDYEAAAASLEPSEESEEGEDIPEGSPRPSRRAIRVPERKTLDQRL